MCYSLSHSHFWVACFLSWEVQLLQDGKQARKYANSLISLTHPPKKLKYGATTIPVRAGPDPEVPFLSPRNGAKRTKIRPIPHVTVLMYTMRLTLWDIYEYRMGLPAIQFLTQRSWKLRLPEKTSETKDRATSFITFRWKSLNPKHLSLVNTVTFTKLILNEVNQYITIDN